MAYWSGGRAHLYVYVRVSCLLMGVRHAWHDEVCEGGSGWFAAPSMPGRGAGYANPSYATCAKSRNKSLLLIAIVCACVIHKITRGRARERETMEIKGLRWNVVWRRTAWQNGIWKIASVCVSVRVQKSSLRHLLWRMLCVFSLLCLLPFPVDPFGRSARWTLVQMRCIIIVAHCIRRDEL